ncbi:hypothetical protein E5288_WYG014230 [Bos mutus]|uniref:Uncharacterized protein n=1 Tax=Bos mutus TaxID=72004 RepID=A0A6B0R5T1_9CETA|nr:hypothetical protein [Bos mutus]
MAMYTMLVSVTSLTSTVLDAEMNRLSVLQQDKRLLFDALMPECKRQRTPSLHPFLESLLDMLVSLELGHSIPLLSAFRRLKMSSDKECRKHTNQELQPVIQHILKIITHRGFWFIENHYKLRQDFGRAGSHGIEKGSVESDPRWDVPRRTGLSVNALNVCTGPRTGFEEPHLHFFSLGSYCDPCKKFKSPCLRFVPIQRASSL